MKPLALLLHPPTISSAPLRFNSSKSHLRNRPFILSCSALQSGSIKDGTSSKSEYKPGILDDFFLNVFRSKMVQEVGWDSEKPGYGGLIEVASRLTMTGRTNSETIEASVRILTALFPPLLLKLYRILVSPIAGGKVAAIMVARVTALTCQWLMGTCTVNSIELPDGSSCQSGVFVEKCKYLEESKCIGICINTCKLPTQSFFKDQMGIPLLMEPNFNDYSCQFKFGVLPPLPEEDSILKEPCLEICPNATRRREVSGKMSAAQCPKA
ncbi:beta-carotene isomerase D27, chloroplastic isoform X1 [Cucumis melo]|uniref:Beta-carotene isomerase D27, chloroplastic isoform X1 n=1 Tax=Cucumis melo TaxID=3656 RepID=A0A1S3BRJ4_CUCME|nr:beta-carotene isomerase D27, chloroplastic isoform X1 [Cucumis melo]